MGDSAAHGRSTDRMVRALEAVLPTSFPSVTFVEVDDSDEVKVGLGEFIARLQWVGDGWPSKLQSRLVRRPATGTVFVATSMSPGAARLISDHGYGWVDERGGAEFVIGTIAVTRPQQRPAPEPRSGWTSATTGVAEALLAGVPATVNAVRDATGLSVGAVARSLKHLTELGAVTAAVVRGPRSARHLDDPGALLDLYVDRVRAAGSRQLQLVTNPLWKDLFAELAQLNAVWSRWAVTGLAAGQLLAPVLTSVTSAVVYVDAATVNDLVAYARQIAAPIVDGDTGRLTLRTFPSNATMRLTTIIDGIPVVPWPRAYADLLRSGVRGEDAAEHLRGRFHG